MADAAGHNIQEIATTGVAAAAPPHLRSCVVCRQRKVKCDRQQPCANCTRSRCQCVYPAGRGRAPKRARRAADAQLADKLARLETIIQRMAAENGPGLVQESQSRSLEDDGSNQMSLPAPEHGLIAARQNETGGGVATSTSDHSSPAHSSVEASMSRLVIDDTKSYYVSNPLWASMAQEMNSQIEELRDFLGQSEDEDDDEKMSPDVHPSQQSNTNAALFGYRAIAHSLQPHYPSLQQAVHLFTAFSENVVPLLRIFHMPSLSTTYWDAIASPTALDKNVEALIFAIFYSATVSLPSDQCFTLLGLTYEDAVERYRFAAEQAIARADLLATQSVVLLQATTLFINALRSHDGSRVSWSLTNLVISLAQTMGLHRDGTAFGLKPFETEMRRRLWWHICILDSRSSDHHGFGSMLYHLQYDTHMPLNVNDEDLSPDMTELPAEREEATDMCFCLVRCEAMVAATKTKLMSPEVPTSANRSSGSASVPLSERIKLIKEFEARLQDRFIRRCNPSSPIQLMATVLSRLIVVHFWLMTYYPLMRQDGNTRDQNIPNRPPQGQQQQQKQPSDTNSIPPTNNHPPNPSYLPPSGSSNTNDAPALMTHDQLFASSVEILQLSVQMLNIDATHRWAWYTKIHIQWHIVAFVLSELCRRPPSAECDQAWAAVSRMYTVWNVQTSGATPGLMWKSVRRLMAKTRYVRELQALRGEGKRPTMATTTTTTAGGGVEGGVVNNTSGVAAAPPAAAVQHDFPSSVSNPPNPPNPVWGLSLGAGISAAAAGQVDSMAQLDFHQGIFGMSDDDFMDLMGLPADLPMEDIFGPLDPTVASFSTGWGNGQSGVVESNWNSG
ncbi:hypothetical protein N0V82_005086 [Gnomoniopsis sp. IMI 355080]|nr:hypothetical protein N0V82_005086 [Gnomoniopsis sp. IMI 355080]